MKTPKSLKALREALTHVEMVCHANGGPSAAELREAAQKLDAAAHNTVMALYRAAGNAKV